MPYPYVYQSPIAPIYTQPTYMAPQQQPLPQQPMQPQPQPQPQPQQTDGLINSGYVVVPSEDEVKRYPVAPGNLMTFKIENEPIVIEKSMSRSQFASPEYKYFKLSEFNKEEEKEVEVDSVPQFDEIKDSIKHIEKRLESLGDSYMELKKLLSRKTPKKEEANE